MSKIISSSKQRDIPDIAFGQQAADQLPWFRIVILLTKLSIAVEREWYAAKTIEYGWSRNVLKKKSSNNRRKAQQRLQKAYQQTTNIKEDIINKLVAVIVMMATRIVVQDDPVKGWQTWWGRR